jgi:hypothetical protein
MAQTKLERSLAGKLGAAIQRSRHDPAETTRAARAASPQSVDYWRSHKHDLDGNVVERPATEIEALGAAEIARRAEAEYRVYFTRLAWKSARARRARKGAG